jgi:hypothetical protein
VADKSPHWKAIRIQHVQKAATPSVMGCIEIIHLFDLKNASPDGTTQENARRDEISEQGRGTRS